MSEEILETYAVTLSSNTVHTTNHIIVHYTQKGFVLDMLPRKLENTSLYHFDHERQVAPVI